MLLRNCQYREFIHSCDVNTCNLILKLVILKQIGSNFFQTHLHQYWQLFSYNNKLYKYNNHSHNKFQKFCTSYTQVWTSPIFFKTSSIDLYLFCPLERLSSISFVSFKLSPFGSDWKKTHPVFSFEMKYAYP